MPCPEWHRFAAPAAMAQELFPGERGGVDAAAPGEVAFGAVVAVFDGVAGHAEQFLHQQFVGGEGGEVVQQAVAFVGAAVCGADAGNAAEGGDDVARREDVADNGQDLSLVLRGVSEDFGDCRAGGGQRIDEGRAIVFRQVDGQQQRVALAARDVVFEQVGVEKRQHDEAVRHRQPADVVGDARLVGEVRRVFVAVADGGDVFQRAEDEVRHACGDGGIGERAAERKLIRVGV